MRKAIETIRKSNTAKNGDERVIIDSNNNKHLEFFMNGSWRHSNKCKIVVNNQCIKKWNIQFNLNNNFSYSLCEIVVVEIYNFDSVLI